MEDDHVAQILAREAKESSIRYASQGLSALMPSKPASNAPKPNTRFLHNLIKVTDSHNSALKKKEEKDARERMRRLKSQSSGASTSTSIERTSRLSHHRDRSPTSRDHRREHKGDRHRSHRRRHRSRSTSAEEDRSKRHRREEDYSEVGHRHRDRDGQRRNYHDHESSEKYHGDREKEHTRRRRGRSYSKSRSRSPHRGRSIDRHRHRHRRQSRRSDNHTRSRYREREHCKSKSSGHADSSSHRSRPETSSRRDRASPPTTVPIEAGEESDPLEELVGPLPPRQNEAPIRSRGRGAYKPNTSNIDAHFAPGYDPTTDVHLEDDPVDTSNSSRRPVAGLMTKDDDWDMALEALRDRARWKQKGEERLRAAGINEGTINQWKNNTALTGTDGESKPEDVQWSKKGEGREWDRGKFVDDDGHIDIRAAW